MRLRTRGQGAAIVAKRGSLWTEPYFTERCLDARTANVYAN